MAAPADRMQAGTVADARLHDMSHGLNSHAVVKGESLNGAGRLLGFRRASSTNRFVHPDGTTPSEATERLALAIGRLLRSRQHWNAQGSG